MIRKKAVYALLAMLLLAPMAAKSQQQGDDSTIGALTLDVEGTLFLQDNEFDSPLAKGFTLPGFRLRPALGYRPNKYVSIEAGASLLHYWGASLYPDGCYLSIPIYNTDNASKNFHATPFLRVEMATNSGWRFVLGNIYGGMQHRLPLPMYVPSNQFTADPEAGAQILYKNNWLDLDIWLDWRTFIYRVSPYKENFYAGLSSRIKYNSETSRVHLYTPVQALAEHRGGEIDTVPFNRVETYVNLNTGLGARFAVDHRYIRNVTLESNFMYSWQESGEGWHDKTGWALWTTAGLSAGICNFKIGHFYAHRFNTIMSSPVFGVTSAKQPGLVLDDTHTLYAAWDCAKQFAPGFMLGARVEAFGLLNCDGYNYITDHASRVDGGLSFLFLAYMRINPSFVIAKLKGK